MGCGAQCVVTVGISQMLEWCVDNLDTIFVSFNFILRLTN